MRRSSRPLHVHLAALATTLAPMLGCGDQPDLTDPGVTSSAPTPTFARRSGSSVSGHAERPFPELGVPIEKFSFHARHLPDGTVQGSWRVMDFFGDGAGKVVASGRITCFTVEADGKTARIGGVVDADRRPEFVGTEAIWTVVDNGEGRKAPRDQATDLRWGLVAPGFSFAAFHCEVGFTPEDFGTFGESVRANVQVRP
jgi:hypothetical protein